MSIRPPDRASIESRSFHFDTAFALSGATQFSDVFCCDPQAVAAQFGGATGLDTLPAGSAKLRVVNGPFIVWQVELTTFVAVPVSEIAIEMSNTLSFANVFKLFSIVPGGVGVHSSSIAHTVATSGGAATTSPFGFRSVLPFWRLKVAETAGGGNSIGGKLCCAGGGW